MEIGINLNSNRPCEEIAEAFLENGIKRTFVCVEHPRFDEAMTTLGKLNIKVENLHAPFKGQNTIWQDGEEGEEMLKRLLWGNRLIATHISDNDMACDKDMHMHPFDGIIDFEKTAREIAECGKNITLMLEIKPYKHERYANMSVKEYYGEAAKK